MKNTMSQREAEKKILQADPGYKADSSKEAEMRFKTL
jgi:hypothetical protein